jgi:hypothetical protein
MTTLITFFNRKIALCSLFSLGIFVMACAILSKYYSFTSPFSPIWEWWYTREASTAVSVANIPHCWALWRRVFNLQAFVDGRTAAGLPPGGTADMSAPRRVAGGIPDISLSQISSPPSQGPARQLSFERSGDVKVEQDTRINEKMMKGINDSSSGEVPQGLLELELRRLEQT